MGKHRSPWAWAPTIALSSVFACGAVGVAVGHSFTRTDIDFGQSAPSLAVGGGQVGAVEVAPRLPAPATGARPVSERTGAGRVTSTPLARPVASAPPEPAAETSSPEPAPEPRTFPAPEPTTATPEPAPVPATKAERKAARKAARQAARTCTDGAE